MKRNRRLFLWGLLVCLCAGIPTVTLFGQSIQYGKLTGKVMTPSGEVLPGVKVEISGNALISGKRTVVTGDTGTYVFLNLPGGKYKITAAMDGFKTVVQENVGVSVGASVVVNLVMEFGKVEETIRVEGAAPVVDTKTSNVDTRIDKQMLDKLPSSRDAFYDLSLLTPGMMDAGKDASWLPSPNAYGGSSTENVFLVNGVNTTNPRGASWGSQINVNYNAVEEVRVISLGAKAEYGSFSGVAVDVVTKSGGNSIGGSAAFYSQIGKPARNVPKIGDDLGRDWLKINPADDIFTESRRDLEANFTLGGPLVKNKIWYFTAFDYSLQKVHEPNFNPTKDNWGRYFDIKLSAEPFPRHRAWVAYHYENNKAAGTSWGSLNWDDSMSYTTKTNNHTVSAQWQWYPSNTTFITLKQLGYWTDDKPYLPENHSDHPGYINWFKGITGDMGINGAFHYIEAQKSRRNTLQADLSHYAENFLGEHDIKFGVQYTTGRGNWMSGYFFGYANYAYIYRYSYNVQYLQETDGGLKMFVRRPYRNPSLVERASDSFGIFLDDQWSLGKRLTVNLGLRYDRMTAKFLGGKVYDNPTDPDSVNDLKVLREMKGSDNVFDFKTWSPRLGISYSLTGDGKTVLRAGYGRYYAPISVENLGKNGPDMNSVHTVTSYYLVPMDGLDLNGDGELWGEEVIAATRKLHGMTPIGDPSISDATPATSLLVDPKLKDQYTDQLTVNLERELFRDFSVSATYILRNTRNIMVQWPINRETGKPYEYDRVPFTTHYGEQVQLYSIKREDYNGDGAFDIGDVGWLVDNTSFMWRNLPDIDGKKARRLYHGIQLSFNKRYSDRWQLLGSVLFASSNGVAARSKRQDFNMEGPNILGDTWVANLNQLVNNMEGILPYTPKFEFKLSGSYRIPAIELDLGMRFRFHTGRALWPLEELPYQGRWDGAVDPEKIIGTGGNFPWIVSPSSKEPLYYPSAKILDLHLEKAFKIGPGSLHLMFDCFNLFNDGTVTNASWQVKDLGRVVGLTYPSRKLWISALYEF